MDLYYAKSKNGNFGDDMNLWFWDKVLPGWRTADAERTLFGIGTILGSSAIQRYQNILVCGSGAGYGHIAPVDPGRVKISWVRGPLTARQMGLEDDIAISDPASLVTTLPKFSAMSRGGKGTIFIPHRSTAQLKINWDRIGQLCNLRVVLPNRDSKKVISEIIAADMVVTESLHGAIFADAFRIPWAPIRISNQFNDFKWNDWASGLGLTINARESLVMPKRMWHLAKSLKTRLSSGRTAVAAPATMHSKDEKRAPETSFDLGEEGRARAKKLVALVAPLIERSLSADIRHAIAHHVHLSSDGQTEQIIDRMQDRLYLLQSKFPQTSA